MVVSGTVEGIVFRNEENGYTVIDFVADGKFLTAVGIFPPIQKGEALTLVGEMKENHRYGEQLDVTEVMFDAPTDRSGIIQYLSSGLFPGVGEKVATAIVNHFGLKTLDVISATPDRLSEVAGVGSRTAHRIGENFKKREGMQNVILFLQKHGITLGQAMKIYGAYEDKAPEILNENPYRLIDDIDGIGFLTADKIAMKLGIERESNFRVMAGITHTLQEEAGKHGHTYLPENELIGKALKILESGDREQAEDCLRVMQLNGKLKTHIFEEEDAPPLKVYALAAYYGAENAVAAKLVRLIAEAETLDVDVAKEIDRYEAFNEIHLHSAQREAITAAVSGGAMVITGGPGTGKTTIIKCIIEILKNRGMRTALAAPTGRAAKRLSEATGMEAKTLHRFLGANFESGKMTYRHNELNLLETDVIIIDEISMADIFIFHALLKAVPVGARLVLVGDKDQLPSVSAGNILADIIASDMMPVICLTEIYRQDAESLIIVNAHRINNGEMPEIRNSSKDFFVDDRQNPVEIVDTVVSMVASRIPRHFGIPVTDIQVLAPTKKGTAGVEGLNAALQGALNPDAGETLQHGYITFKRGDKVMHTVNNYSLKWRRLSGDMEEGEGVFNGDIGYIKDISRREMLVEFEDGRAAIYGKAEMDELMLAYAVTVHKSQGSEFPAVVLVLSASSYLMLSRNLLYTAVTRAKNMVVIVGPKTSLQRMVTNNYTARRYTLLKELLWKNRTNLKHLKKS